MKHVYEFDASDLLAKLASKSGCCLRLQKERDLELAARIGQSLLEKNKVLEAKNDRIQGELDDALEKVPYN